MSSVDGAWNELHHDPDAHVRMVTITADTHTPLGQQLLSDPLTAMMDAGLAVDDSWRVQLQIVNADIPTGPLPLPDEIQPGGEEFSWIWVIRKIIIFVLIFDDLELVVILVRRFNGDREEALDVLERSRAARQSQT